MGLFDRRGAVVVPVEPQSSLDLFRKLEQKVRPRLPLLGDRVPAVNESGSFRCGASLRSRGPPGKRNLNPYRCSVAMSPIVFTSGTTAEPKDVVITHRNLAAQLQPIENQIAPYRKYLRFLRHCGFSILCR